MDFALVVKKAKQGGAAWSGFISRSDLLVGGGWDGKVETVFLMVTDGSFQREIFPGRQNG